MASLAIEPLRADPDGLHLEILCREAQPGDALEVLRKRDGQWSAVQLIEVGEDLVAPLQAGTVHWIDPLEPDPESLQYRIHHIRGETSWLSEPISVDWTGWPDAPHIEATPSEESAPQITISWSDDTKFGARILRRDVLGDNPLSPIAVVDAASGGRFYDTDVEPGGVYAYKLQLIDRQRPLLRVSDLSSEVYVSVPE